MEKKSKKLRKCVHIGEYHITFFFSPASLEYFRGREETVIVIQRPIMVMFCRFGTLLRSITPPLLSPNSPHYGSKSIARVYSCIVYPCSFFTFYLFIFFLINRLGKIFLFFSFFVRSYLSTSDKFLSKSIIFGFDIIIRFFYFKNKSRQNLIQINIIFLRIVKKRVKLFLIMQKNIQEE